MPGDPDLAALVLAARGGDRAAFESIFRRFHEPLWAFAFALIRDRGLAEDAVQEAFLRVHLGLTTLRDPGAFRSWVYRIVEHTALTACRRRRRRREAGLERDARGRRRPAPVSRSADGAEPVSSPEGDRDLEAVRAAMGRLPPLYAEILNRRYLDERSCRDVAEELGISLNNTKVRLHRARRALRRGLEGRAAAPAGAAR